MEQSLSTQEAVSQPEITRISLRQRIVQFPLTRIVLGMGVVVFAALIGGYGALTLFEEVFGLAPQDSVLAGFTVQFTAVLAMVVAYAGYVRFVEARPVDELSREGAIREFDLGAILGSALFAL
ncbi:hypothetical protein [Halococcus hamelinensis]|uniref:Uncharacterized protein n=1 Tax=Halococcus hamelinensis 100A6 TaxID=1132509 RepID=M0M8D3_9EURY|nr:hypothetical protein [Halococcus hamelinensis]EMA41986.1 hypothetical protein C447_00310 [Halococcus hamelinensis 100A6]